MSLPSSHFPGTPQKNSSAFIEVEHKSIANKPLANQQYHQMAFQPTVACRPVTREYVKIRRAMMSAKRGCIVNISALTAVDERKNAANYCSSKAGLNMLTNCMALELAPHVNVNCLALGFIDSPLVRELYTKGHYQ